MDKQKIVMVLERLAHIASQGTYHMDPAGARKMNAVFDEAAALINELEKEDDSE